MNLKETLIDGLKSIGSFDVKIADAQEAIPHAIEERAPSRMFPEAKSVVVFVTAMAPQVNNAYFGVYSPFEGTRPLGPGTSQLLTRCFGLNI